MSEPLLRYQLTKNGISPRWIPGAKDIDGNFLPNFFANGDEHNELGSVDESPENAIKMADKRSTKQKTILQNLPEPEVFGPIVADISFVGFGSSRNVLLDLINFLEKTDLEKQISSNVKKISETNLADFELEKTEKIENLKEVLGNSLGNSQTKEKENQKGNEKIAENPNPEKSEQENLQNNSQNLYTKLGFRNNLWDRLNSQNLKVNYLHFSYLWPIKTEKFQEFITRSQQNNSKICLIEGNSTGQLGTLITSQIGYQFPNKFLKYDGRQFFIEDLIEFINKLG